ncbi:MAG: hypothetical protein M5U19_07095 [Microthrixaceae bacterium]|nr:hypothetical protein [Microthrixaceae bacterium]
MTEHRKPFGTSTAAMAVNGTDNGAPDVGSLVPPPTGDAPSSGSSRRRPADRNEHALVAVVVVVGAIMAMLVSDAAPTATTWIDALERGLFVAVVASAASRARRWAWCSARCWSRSPLLGRCCCWGLPVSGVSVLQVETRTRNRTVGAVTGATVALVSLGLSVPGPTGIETVLAVAATAPIMASGYRRAMPGARRSVRRAALALLIVLAVSLVVTVIAGVMASGRVDSAIELTNRAVDAAESGAGSESAGCSPRPTMPSMQRTQRSVRHGHRCLVCSRWWVPTSRRSSAQSVRGRPERSRGQPGVGCRVRRGATRRRRG